MSSSSGGSMGNFDDERFIDWEELGSSGQGIVYSATDLTTNSRVALKVIPFCDDQDKMEKAMREGNEMMLLRHDNVLRVTEMLKEEGEGVILVMELMDIDLRKYLNNSPKLEPNVIKSFLHQILKGVDYIHGQGTVHRDLKPDNLLLDSDRKILKISDFGHCGNLNDPLPKVCWTTIQYNAPEVVLSLMDNTAAVDVWSVGCIFAEMFLRKRRLFTKHAAFPVLQTMISFFGMPSDQDWPNVTDAIKDVFEQQAPLADMEPPENLACLFPDTECNAIDLLLRMLEFLPDRRISVADALDHPYFKE